MIKLFTLAALEELIYCSKFELISMVGYFCHKIHVAIGIILLTFQEIYLLSENKFQISRYIFHFLKIIFFIEFYA